MKGEMEGNYSPFSRINLMMGQCVAGDEPSGVDAGQLSLAAGAALQAHGVPAHAGHRARRGTAAGHPGMEATS